MFLVKQVVLEIRSLRLQSSEINILSYWFIKYMRLSLHLYKNRENKNYV